MAHYSDAHLSNGGLLQGLKSSDKFKKLTSLADDITVLRSIWFSKAKGGDHASRLEQFYAPQAHACTPFFCKILAAMLSGPFACGGPVCFIFVSYFTCSLFLIVISLYSI